ncbi:uncharacterized protein TrAtP1_007572 [Trichoderma atroviride]|uniref:Uncharacterized protein n=1 Tax=Hypocrea atroviridis (strain ATCC 20476 / IMI 206040) TaxID=452589 RepID=G9NGQ4_HYPAI|nr:uncharacterized protein TRIATDRAFT_270229 [Trichoderma atroviride IMI 206040]EHK50465.1 hypothetical protein TRIATDRAFT_270229 [Trichoderma atroviride IMI 206040]UKZ66396.1 hypothetical protein TrAtP1_007572 [Trichoderma atroviride]
MDKQLVLARETQGATVQDQMELSSPVSSETLALQQRMRANFVELQEQRLHKLISEGHLCVGGRSLVWVDEHGLLTAQNMSSKYPREKKPFFHAGSDADVTQISKSKTISRHCWGKEHSGSEKDVLGSLLEHLVTKEIKYLPITTHLTWKNLLADLESSTATHTPTSVMFKKLKEAITEEKDDWGHLDFFVDNCEDQKEFFDIDLDALSAALYRIAGVDAHRSKPWIALRQIDEDLADEIFTLCNLAKRVQTEELSLEQLPCLSELVNGLRDTLWEWKMVGKMDRLFKVMEAKVFGRS